jgi:hypothetical protein
LQLDHLLFGHTDRVVQQVHQLSPTILPTHDGRQPALHDRTITEDERRLVNDLP